MRVVIGPVSRQSAQAWIAYARRIVDVLDTLAPGECFSTPEVRAVFDSYLADWEAAADQQDVFLWERDLPAEQVEYHVHAFHQVATMLAQRDGDAVDAPGLDGGEEFYSAVLRGALTALEAESPASSAFAQHLGEFWPGQALSLH